VPTNPNGDAPLRIFISHAHADAVLVSAFKELLERIFGRTTLTIDYSSDDSPGGGIQAGTPWLDWILDKVRTADIVVVVLTPESLGRPWLMWESGAATGIALASQRSESVMPLLFRVNREDVTSPLSHLQAVQGDTDKGIERAVQAVWARLHTRPEEEQLEMLLHVAKTQYFHRLEAALRDRPQSLDEGTIQEWCQRLDELRAAGRYAEVTHIHRALLVAVGPADGETDVPLDVRLHRRLGELYLAARQGAEAVAQFELALRVFGRDVFLLHKLALAQLQADDHTQALNTLRRIEEIDSSAVLDNPEVAGLKGRLYREKWERHRDKSDLQAARDAYEAAWKHSPDSYYMAGNVGELSLALDDRRSAQDAYRKAVDTISRSGERSLWSLATLAAAAIVEGDEAEALALLGEIGSLSPSARDIESISRGLRRLQELLRLPEQTAATWLGALRGGRPSSGVPAGPSP
jgi:tetratricopeptide (TPR) repeat protein